MGTKLCWNCEGSVARDAENCIYCGVYLHPEEAKPEVVEEVVEEMAEEIAPPYTPPLQQKQIQDESESLLHKPLYTVKEDEHAVRQEQQNVAAEPKNFLLPLVTLLGGSIFFLFAMLLYFFAEDGLLIVRWNTYYWFIYLFFALPLLFFGWTSLQTLEEA